MFNEGFFPFNHPLSFPHTFSDVEDYDFLDNSLTSIDSQPITSTPDSCTDREDVINFLSSDNDLTPELEIPSSELADRIVPIGIVEGDTSCGQSSSSKPSFRYQDLTAVASKNISSAIDAANILPSRSRRSGQAASTTVEIPTQEPRTYAQALSRPDRDDWIEGIARELQTLKDMGVWEETELPNNAHALGTTWVFKRKTGPNGELIKFKARLCAQGSKSREWTTQTPTHQLADYPPYARASQ